MSTSYETAMNARPIDVRPMKFTEYRRLQEHDEEELFPTLNVYGAAIFLYMNDSSLRVLKLSLPKTLDEDLRCHIFSNTILYPLRFMAPSSFVSWTVKETHDELVMWCIYNLPGRHPTKDLFYVNEISVQHEPSHARLHHDTYHYESRSHIHLIHENTPENKWKKTHQRRRSMDDTESQQKKNQVLSEIICHDVLNSPHIVFHTDIDEKFKLHES